MKTDVDVLIAGGGTTGLAAAIFASRAGLRAMVIDPVAVPHDKPCGEGLLPGGKLLLEELGVSAQLGHPFAGIAFNDTEGRRRLFPFRQGPGMAIRRSILSEKLYDLARQAGVEILRGTVRTVAEQADHISAEGITAKYLVAADGLRSKIRDYLGLTRQSWLAGRLGVRCHFAVAESSAQVEIYWGPGFEIYVTPVEPMAVGVAVLSKDGVSIAEALEHFPQLHRRLGEQITKLAGAGPFGRYSYRQQHGRVFFAGDAAGILDPITGEGQQLGIAAAKLLVRTIRTQQTERYHKLWWKMTRPYWWLTSSFLLLSRMSFLRNQIVPTVSLFPGVVQKSYQLLSSPHLMPVLREDSTESSPDYARLKV